MLAKAWKRGEFSEARYDTLSCFVVISLSKRRTLVFDQLVASNIVDKTTQRTYSVSAAPGKLTQQV